jgi:hypothetical protein
MTQRGDPAPEAEHAIIATGVEATAEQRCSFAHADQPVPTAPSPRAARRQRVCDCELEHLITERELDPDVPGSVAVAFVSAS